MSLLILFLIYCRYSDGGRMACWLTNQNPSVEMLILVSTSAYASDREKRIYSSFGDTSLWGEEKRRVFENIYGFDGLRKNFSNYLKEVNRLQVFIPPDILKGINCPTLIIHGQRDVVVRPDYALYLQKRIQNSKVMLFDAGHEIMKEKSIQKEINEKIHEFLLKDN